MKALEKDRTRRYETANGFAADVLRHLANEPVVAAPPSRAYRMRKFVRKNRGRVIAASLVLAALVVGIVGTTLGLFQARRQEQIAQTLATKEATARGRSRGPGDEGGESTRSEADRVEGRAARPRGLRQPRQPGLSRGGRRQRRAGRGPAARLPARAARLGVALRQAALQPRAPRPRCRR